VDHGAAGEVEDRPAGGGVGEVQDAADAPDHVRHGAINDQRPEAEKDGHRTELDALGEGAGDQRRGDDGEHQLVDHEALLGDGAAVVGIGIEADAAQEGVLQSADEAVARAEGQRVADHGPENGDQAHHGEALHHGAEDVLAAHQAAIEKDQAGSGHHQDQGGRDQHPGIVAGGLGVMDGLGELGNLFLSGGRRRANARSNDQGAGGNSQADKENQQRDCATTHKIPLQNEFDEQTEMQV
jgi:hypothetical protein